MLFGSVGSVALSCLGSVAALASLRTIVGWFKTHPAVDDGSSPARIKYACVGYMYVGIEFKWLPISGLPLRHGSPASQATHVAELVAVRAEMGTNTSCAGRRRREDHTSTPPSPISAPTPVAW